MPSKKNKSISRRDFLRRALYSGALATLPPMLLTNGCGRKEVRPKPRNIILISIDTLRADHLGCYGYNRPTSPVLDEFAQKGLIFNDVTATSPWTLPSHGTMLTGLYPNKHGLNSSKKVLPMEIKTVADIFKDKGFQTAAVVNSYYLTPRYGLHKGFESCQYIKEISYSKKPSEVGTIAQHWLKRGKQKPFFLFMHYYDLHSDYRSLPEYERQFLSPYKGIANGTTQQLVDYCMGYVNFDKEDQKHLIDLYDASIRQMDDELGKLFSFLKKEKLLDDTLVIITSDHGEEFLEHGGVLHSQTQYQEQLHIPLIFHWPGLGQHKRINEMVSLVDLMPTILAVMGFDIPKGLDGIDLSSLWQQTEYDLPLRYIFSGASKLTGPLVSLKPDQHDIMRAVRYGQYKMHYNKLTRERRLYDLHSDRYENVDVATKHKELANSMMGHLKKYMQAAKDGTGLTPLQEEEINKLKSLGYL